MSNTQKKNVPELRFPEFEGEWEEKQLGEIFQIISGSTPLKSNKKFYENGNINWVKTTDLNNSKVTHSKEKITEYAMNSLKLKLVPKNSVLIAMYGGFNQIGRTGLLKIDATINQAISALLMNHETNPEFIQAYLNYQVKGWKRYAASSRKDPNITKKDIEQFKVPYVSINEQQKIGEFFSKLDRQIELEEQKLELLQLKKKGYMQKIFSQELRFKDENGNDYPIWTNERLGEVTTVTMGQSPKSVNYTDNSNDMVLIQGNADIENGLINPRIYTREVTKLIQKDEIILTVRAPVGKLAMAQINACIGRGVCSIKGDKFLYYFLEWFATQNKWIRFSQGSTFESISGNDIRNIHIKIPVEDERTKIIKLLNSLDVLNSKTDLKIQNLKQRKQSLLQKIFV
ncbi:restriction endonuclease subunit S [Staphylococcus aureus]|uniref:restriction endonuclease subunit S n=1 Tax=Staphylococcus aureus TaxID=1280 RepID=UPI002DBD5BE9|nr:restriction endonuclease subunit S [Staphylococcus aureus]MEB6798118.1 restriction endonuclease subunit S [Staphylococcus aureus]MEB6816351.1 restriction endonuclease subunit S [Staphylococcus aureus]